MGGQRAVEGVACCLLSQSQGLERAEDGGSAVELTCLHSHIRELDTGSVRCSLGEDGFPAERLLGFRLGRAALHCSRRHMAVLAEGQKRADKEPGVMEDAGVCYVGH